MLLAVAGLTGLPCFADSEESSTAVSTTSSSESAVSASSAPLETSAPEEAGRPAAASPRPSPASAGSAPRVGVGVMGGLLGFGGDVAVRVLPSANVRFGFSGLGISQNFDKDGISYGARLRLESAQLTFDYFFFHGFHLSPGLLIYNGNKITGTASAPAGSQFTLNSVNYESGSANPLTGTLAVTFRKAAPMILVGLGNLVPRGRRRWSVTFDVGAAFSGSPNAALNLTGLACTPPFTSGATCKNIATDPTVQSNVQAEQSSVNDKLKFFKVYPVVTVGFGYSF